MTSVFETVKTDGEGNVLELSPVMRPDLRVTSDQLMPKGMGLGTQVFVIDKMDVAICDGKNNWYAGASGKVTVGQAGQPFSVLFA